MLLSVWDLLTETATQLQSGVTSINTKRDLLIAESDLQWVLQGGEPANFVSIGAGGGASPE